ncbi:CynX/NimT family MFS transporter [Ornithinibacillus scapharcae]|uniref:CynX/NimT family MFS transporter n=1 Tax=Ornithinibacillus scapharcae TaxID=1147159 RepID=UPI003B430828
MILVAFNLRPAITSVGPLMSTIRDDVGLSNWSVGLLTSLPLIAFAIMSPIAARLGNRFSNERAILWGLIVLGIGVAVRSNSAVLLIFLGTLLIGVGIAICNVLLPGVVKDKFPLKVGLMTSIYSTAMGVFASTASGVSVPIASGMNLGWIMALLVWALPVVLAIIMWFYLALREKKTTPDMPFVQVADSNLWKSPLAWQIAAYMGLQSFLFYVTISWLPEILHSNGMSMETAGWMLSFTQFIGLPASFIVPVIAGKFSSQRPIVLTIGIISLVGLAGLLLGSSYFVLILSIILLGLALSGTFALALALLGMRARNAKQAASLSGMAQALGYLLAAVGPIFIGYLFDLTTSWTAPIITMMIVSVLVVLFGLGAGRNRYV